MEVHELIVISDSDSDESPIKPTPKKADKDGVIRPNGTLKLKRPAPKMGKPGNWREGSLVEDDKKSRKATESPAPGTAVTSPGDTGPVVNPLDDAARETFRTGRPLEDSPDMSVCAHCNKSVLKSSLKAHMKACLSQQNKKKEKLMAKEKARLNSEREREREKEKAGPAPLKVKKVQLAASAAAAAAEADGDAEDDDDAEGDEVEAHQPHPPKKTVASGIAAVAGGIKAAKKSAGKNTGGGDGEKKQGKKRKAEAVDAADSSKGPKAKKKKEEPKPKAPKPKGPVDVERQCGVMTPNGVPCARSLTCKSHSMGAKRAVAGRSLPYDMLLAAYQKKNQAKQQKAAIDANAPLEDEDDPAAGPVDSDEETAAVMASLSHWAPRPWIDQAPLLPIKRRYQLARLREQLDNATSGGTVNIFRVTSKNGVELPPQGPQGPQVFRDGAGGSVFDGEDAPGEVDYGAGFGGVASRRGSVVGGGGFGAPAIALPQRRGSLVGHA